MNLGQVTYEVTENIRRYGVGIAARDVAYRAAGELIPLTILKGLTAEPRDVDPAWFMGSRVLTRFATDREVLDASSQPEWAGVLPPATASQLLDSGSRCVGSFDSGRLVSIAWYSRHAARISDRYWLRFSGEWVCRHHPYTLPEYRTLRLDAAGTSWAVLQYADEGARGLLSCIDTHDFVSQRAARKMGYRAFGEFGVAIVAGREIAFASPGCRPFQVSLGPLEPAGSTELSRFTT